MHSRKPSFIHLSVRSDHSVGSSVGRVSGLVAAASRKGTREALALTDAGTLAGVPAFVRECRGAGIEPLLGMDVAIRPVGTSRQQPAAKHEQDDLFSKNGSSKRQGFRLPWAGLIAENEEGWKNLTRLASTIEASATSPLDMSFTVEELAEFSEGLIVRFSTLGEGGEDYGAASAALGDLRDVYGRHSTFQELYPLRCKGSLRQMETALQAAEAVGVATLLTNRVRFSQRQQANILEAMKASLSNEVLGDADDVEPVSGWVCELDYFTPQTLPLPRKSWGSGLFDDMVSNVHLVAERSSGVADIIFPEVPVPKIPEFHPPATQTEGLTFRKLVEDGVRRRWGPEVPAEVSARIQKEVELFESTGTEQLMLAAHSVVSESDRMEFHRGSGRGSVVASAASYALGITDVDPIKHRLPLERFLSESRHRLPDIDIDVEAEARDTLIHWLVGLYGHERVALIPVYAKFTRKTAWQAAAQVLDMSPIEAIKAGERLAERVDPDIPLRNLPQGLVDEIVGAGVPRRLLSIAAGFEGLIRDRQTNPAGIALLDERGLSEIPVNPNAKQSMNREPLGRLAYNSYDVDWLGVAKLDLLSSKYFTFLREVLRSVRNDTGDNIDLSDVDLLDPATWELLSSGDSSGVFQLESETARQLMQKSQVSNFDDLCALMAVNRPGPMNAGTNRMWAEHCAAQTHWDGWPKTMRQDMNKILSDSRGLVIYQEHLLSLAQTIAGYSAAEAEDLRQQLKTGDYLQGTRHEFVEGCINRGYSPADADKLFDELATVAGYLYSKCHAVAYAKIAYQAAWLRSHYPSQFFIAQLAMMSSRSRSAMAAFSAARRAGLKFEGPTVNGPSRMTSSDKADPALPSSVAFGFGDVKGVSDSERSLIQRRQSEGPFLSFTDFLVRVGLGVSAPALKALSNAGAFDEFNIASRRALAASSEMFSSAVLKAFDESDARNTSSKLGRPMFEPFSEPLEPVRSNQMGPRSMFAASVLDVRRILRSVPSDEYSQGDLIAAEFATLGYSISHSPFDLVRTSLREAKRHHLTAAEDVRAIGVVVSVSRRQKKSGRNAGQTWAVVTVVADNDEQIEGKLSVDTYRRTNGDSLTEGDVIEASGRPSEDGPLSIWVSKWSKLVPDAERDDCPTFEDRSLEEVRDLIRTSPKWEVFTTKGTTAFLPSDAILKRVTLDMLNTRSRTLRIAEDGDGLLVLLPVASAFHDSVVDQRCRLVNIGEVRLEKREADAVRVRA